MRYSTAKHQHMHVSNNTHYKFQKYNAAVRLGYWSLVQETAQWLQTGYCCSKVSKAKYTNTGLFEQFFRRLLNEISIETYFSNHQVGCSWGCGQTHCNPPLAPFAIFSTPFGERNKTILAPRALKEAEVA